jgi:hypothetical protein
VPDLGQDSSRLILQLLLGQPPAPTPLGGSEAIGESASLDVEPHELAGAESIAEASSFGVGVGLPGAERVGESATFTVTPAPTVPTGFTPSKRVRFG